MKITFEEMKVEPEQKSYHTNLSFIDIKIGMNTNNLNLALNPVNLSWKVKNKKLVTIMRGASSIKIGNFSSSLRLDNLLTNEIYSFEIESIGGYVSSCIIFTGDMTSFKIVDENFIFPNGEVGVYGDIILDSCRQLKFPDNWKTERANGNGIVSFDDKYYLFAPKKIFTSRRDLPDYFYFSPFTGIAETKVNIFVKPKIERIGEYCFNITPPSRINITYLFKKFRENQVDGLYEIYNYKEPKEFDTGKKVEQINVLNYEKSFTSFKFDIIY